jgi:hypothetical protein
MPQTHALANEFLVIYPDPPNSINGKKLWMRDVMQGLRWFHAETATVVLSRYTVGIWLEPCFISGALPAIAGNSVGHRTALCAFPQNPIILSTAGRMVSRPPP